MNTVKLPLINCWYVNSNRNIQLMKWSHALKPQQPKTAHGWVDQKK